MHDSSTRARAGGIPARPALAAALALAIAAGLAVRGDTVVMKNGVTYRTVAAPDRDNTLVFLWDGLKKIVVRDSKIERVVADNVLRTGEKFSLVQPMTVHAGLMPKEVVSVTAEPWNEKGRRRFQYLGRSSKPIVMEQAINEISPNVIRYRGVDGFWQGQIATRGVPREVLMGLLRRVEQQNQGERERVVRFLMGAGWYPEARSELDRLIKDFPNSDLSERASNARQFIVQAEATQRRSDVDAMRRAQQFKAAAALLKTFDDKEIGTELQIEARDLARRDEDQRQADLAVGNELRRVELKLAPQVHAAWKGRLAEVHRALAEAPDAVRDRLAAWRKAKAEATASDEAEFALAMSGYVAGQDSAVPDLAAAGVLWQARDEIAAYLTSADDTSREEIAARLDDLEWPEGTPEAPGFRKMELAERICRLMPPPLRRAADEAEKGVIKNVVEADDSIPTTYLAKLPPEYHHSRSYPAVVVLHSGTGPQAAVDEWQAEAARRGYVLIAPEYGAAEGATDYHYTPGEHAAVELALRDARRRYAIDPDRVFVAGQLAGGNMAWDLGLGHPDLFAGVVVVSGFPAKYVPRSLAQHERLPLLCVLGDLAPAANEVVFGSYLKPMILKVWDVTYMEVYRRGLEEFPEDVPTYFDWMEPRRREPFPKSFEASTARTCDDRRHGIVVKGFTEGRTTAAEAVEPLGRNLNPATLKMRTSSLSNLVDLTVSGVDKLDVWLNPKLVDFKRKLEVRVNRKALYKGQPKLDLRPMLEDLRLRGDRGQMYWVKIEVG
ncbi:PHB depolymerase family esterase [Paludisphaera mucosa]|uniref:PHB depolymerase family esterase n=1 Tax=Paludisphaera mucosa TaxID=3030827 RepID=A0ABT6F9P8_9BACT|nr:PHB depolymerase family esterase [Paludisphaera mucosa]MDG3004302.1 PHB depolymerase family esterase [Paludisphaera mucosa]